MANEPEPRIADNPQDHRYEAHVGDTLAGYAEYQLAGDTITFTHTIVDPEYEGQGVGSSLAGFALDDARRRGLKGVAECQFIAVYARRHPEYAELFSKS